MKIIYHPDKDNINIDILSYLIHLHLKILEDNDNKEIYGFIIIIIGINISIFKVFEEEYSKDKYFLLIYENIKKKLIIKEIIFIKDLSNNIILLFYIFE